MTLALQQKAICEALEAWNITGATPITPFSEPEFAIGTIIKATATDPELEPGAAPDQYDLTIQFDNSLLGLQKTTVQLSSSDPLVKRQVVCMRSCLKGIPALRIPKLLLVGFPNNEKQIHLLTVPPNAPHGKLTKFPKLTPKKGCSEIVSAKIIALQAVPTGLIATASCTSSSSSSGTASAGSISSASVACTTTIDPKAQEKSKQDSKISGSSASSASLRDTKAHEKATVAPKASVTATAATTNALIRCYMATLDAGLYGMHRAVLPALSEETASNFLNARVAAFVHGQSIDVEIMTVTVGGEQIPFCIERLLDKGAHIMPPLGIKLHGV